MPSVTMETCMKSLLLSEHDPPPHSTAGRVIVLAFTKGSLLWSNTASLCWCSYVFIVIVFQFNKCICLFEQTSLIQSLI